MSNNFYNNTETYPLPPARLFIDGEIENPGFSDFSGLPLRSVIVKETLLDEEGGNRFTGAFRYDGYSLFDLLEHRIIRKVHGEIFNSVIDLYVEAGNAQGLKSLISWGEIFYPYDMHKILIATGVARIVPTKTLDMWVLPETSRLIIATDLVSERNISLPEKLSIRSLNDLSPVNKGMSPMYSGLIRVLINGKHVDDIREFPASVKDETYDTIFYGRGRGIHSTTPFNGVMLKKLLEPYLPVNSSKIRNGIIGIKGGDGYRCSISYSELFNRNDQHEFLLIRTEEGIHGGLFRMFAANDYFSDRAVKSICEINLFLDN
jgi:hypothetical protein